MHTFLIKININTHTCIYFLRILKYNVVSQKLTVTELEKIFMEIIETEKNNDFVQRRHYIFLT